MFLVVVLTNQEAYHIRPLSLVCLLLLRWMFTLMPSSKLVIAAVLLLCASCVSLDTEGRRLEAVFGVQDGSHGDVSAIARPVTGINLLGKECKSGLQGAVSLYLSGQDFGGLNEGNVTTDTSSLSAATGMRWNTSITDGAARPFIGAGLALQHLDIEFSPGVASEEDSAIGLYLEIGVRFGDVHLACRRIGGMDMEFATTGEVAAVLDQFLVGWTFGF